MSATFPGLVHDAEVLTRLFTFRYIFNTAGSGELVRVRGEPGSVSGKRVGARAAQKKKIAREKGSDEWSGLKCC